MGTNKVQLKVYVQPAAKKTLEDYASAFGVTQSAAVEGIITEVLAGELSDRKTATAAEGQ
jgi:hypothetical protein